MTQILLEIPQQQDLELLLSLVKRLNIRVVQRKTSPPLTQQKNADTVAYILAGPPEKKDFDTFLQDFEESRRDRPMPDREN